MHLNPFFSIVIPVFNRAHRLGAALDSVLAQQWQDRELIVVDDGSTDEIDQVSSQYRPRGVMFLSNRENLGVGPTRNKGVRASRGKWIAFLDSDSCLLPGALSALHSTIQSCDANVGVVYGKSAAMGATKKPGPSGPSLRRWNFHDYLGATDIEEGLPVTRREILLRFPFEERLDIKRECGSLVWYAIGSAGYDFVWTQDLVQEYELSPDGLSGKRFLGTHPEEMVICNQKILERFGGDLLHVNKKKLVVLHQKTAFYCLMAGRRSCALRHSEAAWKLDPLNPRTWALMVLCYAGARTARWLYPVAG